nr:GNAT family N-acetyltransferase [Devosia subaequoris]
MPAVETFERAGLLAWPGIEVDWDGAWVRRAANGYTKRANSIQCFDPADQGEAEVRLAQAVDWLTERNLPPVVRTTPLESPALTAALDAANWRRIDLSHLYAMPLTPQQPDPGGTILDLADPLFLSAQRDLQHYQPDQMHKLQSLLASMTVPACGIVVEREGNVVASGLMAIADGIVITGNVITDPARRRQGLAAAMMRTGLSWANAKGARFAALNVQADNAAAKALYASLGYTHQYDYSYRIPGGPA